MSTLSKHFLALRDVSTIYSIFSLYTICYFSINLSEFAEMFVFIAKIVIKIVIV